MAVTVNRYPASGGSVTYWIENLNDTSKKIHFDVTVNAGHKLTYFKYSNDVTSNQDSLNIDGPVTRTDLYVQSYSTESVHDHVFSVFFDGADPGHEDEYYDLNIYVSVDPFNSGSAWAEPDRFEGVPVGVTSSFRLYAEPRPGYIFDHWERDETGATSTSNPWSGTSTPSSPGEYERNYTAYFRVLETYVFTAVAAPESGGTVNGEARYTESFVEGGPTTVSVTAEPKPGFIFYRWVKDGTTTTVRTATLERTLTSSESWTAEFTTSIIRIPVSVIPRASEHGQHGQVVVTDNTTEVSRTFVESGVFEATPRTSLTNPTLYASVSMLATVSGPEYKIVRYVFRNGDTKGISRDSVDARSSNFVDGERIKVFFGCGKLLHKKDTDDLLEHDGRLVYCG